MTTKSGIVSIVIPVFRDGERAASAVARLLSQATPNGTELEIIIVDDGSNDGTAEQLAHCTDRRVRLYPLTQNQGRSTARNLGAQQAQGEVVVFMDCDCLPDGDGFLAAHLDTLRQSHIASTGPVTGIGGGFWERYQHDASSRRERQHALGGAYSGSSQNLAVLKSVFELTGGFDVQYRHYGFEDRDLLLRLSRFGSVAWAHDAGVRHMDELRLPDISRKMIEAGEYSAGQFARRHPAAYQVLGYAFIDARLQPWLRPIGQRLGPLMPSFAHRIEPLLHKRWIPYVLAKAAVKVVSAMSFLYGTTRANRGVVNSSGH